MLKLQYFGHLMRRVAQGGTGELVLTCPPPPAVLTLTAPCPTPTPSPRASMDCPQRECTIDFLYRSPERGQEAGPVNGSSLLLTPLPQLGCVVIQIKCPFL